MIYTMFYYIVLDLKYYNHYLNFSINIVDPIPSIKLIVVSIIIEIHCQLISLYKLVDPRIKDIYIVIEINY